MNTPPDHPGHPYEPARGGPPRYTPTEWPSGRQREPAPAPPQLKRLLNLTLVSGGLYLLNSIITMIASATTELSELYQRMGVPAEQTEELTGQMGSMTGQMGTLTVASSLLMLAVALGLYVLVYVFLGKGANWARILGIVLAILSAVSVLFGFFAAWLYGGWAIAMIAVGLAFIVLNIAWLVTALRAPLRDWFTAQRYIR